MQNNEKKVHLIYCDIKNSQERNVDVKISRNKSSQGISMENQFNLLFRQRGGTV